MTDEKPSKKNLEVIVKEIGESTDRGGLDVYDTVKITLFRNGEYANSFSLLTSLKQLKEAVDSEYRNTREYIKDKQFTLPH